MDGGRNEKYIEEEGSRNFEREEKGNRK